MIGNRIEPFAEALDLLDRAVCCLIGAVWEVDHAQLDARTPCGRWDLRMLLAHVTDSLQALDEAITTGRLGAEPLPDPGAADPCSVLRDRAGRLRGSCASGRARTVLVGPLPLDGCLVAAAGAIEIAVHSWDIARACRGRAPIPDPLAAELLALAWALVPDGSRQPQFRPPVPVPHDSGASDQLVGFLGRDPAWHRTTAVST